MGIAGKEDIQKWFEAGAADGRAYMLVIYDRMGYPDNPDYPVYANTPD